ncbi:MAG: M56 family metallopeptidase [Hyphomicrobiales bacterium]
MGELLQYVILGNATLIAAFFCAWLIEKTAIMVNLRTAYRLRLHLAVAALCAAALPIILSPFTPLLSSLFSINGTDLIVTHYLKGNINLSATQVSDILYAKDGAIDAIFGGSSLFSKIVLLLFGLAAFLRVGYIGSNILKIHSLINNSTIRFQTRRISVKISRNTIIPFSTRGFFKYYILIPENLVTDPRALKIALGHEIQHIRQGDVDYEVLLSIVSPLFALNPAFWFLSDRIHRFREYTCDAAFLNKGSVAARDYCLLLLDIASRAARNKAHKKSLTYATSVPFYGRDGIFNRKNKSTLRKRIIALSQGSSFIDDGFGKFVNIAPAIILFVIIGTGVLMAAKPTDWSHDRLMLSTVVNLERLDRINGFGIPPLR